MIKVMFVCHGNICRSPMAEFLLKEIVKEKGVEENFLIKSSATSYEEIGNPVHYGTARILDKLKIDYSKKVAEKLKSSDYDKYDYFIGMDKANLRNMKLIFGSDREGKISLLLSYAGENRDVSDPWWTGDFETTYKDIKKGVNALYEFIKKEKPSYKKSID